MAKPDHDTMYTLEAVQRILSDVNMSIVAKQTGLSRQLVWRTLSGRANNPKYETVKRLSDYIELARHTPALQMLRD